MLFADCFGQTQIESCNYENQEHIIIITASDGYPMRVWADNI